MFKEVMEDDEISSHVALPANPLLKTKRVTGVRKANLQSVSIRFTSYQKAMMTPRIPRRLSIISEPQKSIFCIFALMVD